VAAEAPLVTVIVPCFDAEAYLREALDSILDQTYPHVEVLCMDDASTDRTAEILAEYGGRVVHHRQERNRGIYDNVDDGIAVAHGELIATYHADDVYLPTIVERQVDFLQRHPEAGAVFASDILVDADNVEYGRLSLPPELSGGAPIPFAVLFNSILTRKNRYLVCPTAMVRRSVYEEIGGYRQDLFRNSADLDCWIRIAERWPIGILEEHLIRYRHSERQSSRRYHTLRTRPENHFLIMDHHLEAGAGAAATPRALAAYEGHRAEDRLRIAVNHYILGDRVAFGRALRSVYPSAIARAAQVQRGRLLVLYALLRVAAVLPRSERLAGAFRRHWYEDKLKRSRVGFLNRLRLTLTGGA
jgi:glycosyltransferase involved in cell wall biosynthesis